MKRTAFLFFILLLFAFLPARSQDVKRLTLDDVMQLSEEQSPNALIAKHRFRSSYWEYRTFVAEYRPSLTLNGTLPDYTHSYTKYTSSSGVETYVGTNSLESSLSLSIAQNIGLTGGSLFLESDLSRLDDLSDQPFSFKNGSTDYTTTPLRIGLSQPIFRYNELRWQKKIEPLKYEQAKKTYISNIETVHLLAVKYFFNLALAQINSQIASTNLHNADTLYKIAKGRYNLGTISEDELLQMQLTNLNAGTSINEAEISLRDSELKLRSFLGYNENVRLELVIPGKIPDLEVDMGQVLKYAEENNPDLIGYQRDILEAQSSLAQAKAEKGLNANLKASYGLYQLGSNIPASYKNPNEEQIAALTFTLPIMDWGQGRGKYKMAKSSLELTEVQSEQSRIDFMQQLMLAVQQFNLQDDQVKIAAKADTVAAKMFMVTKQRFLIGKIDVLELNNADTKKDSNRRAYIEALNNYWTYFYNLRAVALFDFLMQKPLDADYRGLVK
jgi:outer membrane protein TolC